MSILSMFPGGGGSVIKSIQYVNFELSSSYPTDLAINEVDISKAIIMPYGTSKSNIYTKFLNATFLSSTVLRVTATQAYGCCVIVEFSDEVKRIQTGTVTVYAPWVTVTISEIDKSKSLLFLDAGLAITPVLTTTSIQIYKYSNTATTTWYIVEFN